MQPTIPYELAPAPTRLAAWAERRPLLFALAIMASLVIFSILTQAFVSPLIDLIGLDMINVLASVVVFTAFAVLTLTMRWWREVGFRAPSSGSAWTLLILPLIVAASLQNGITVTAPKEVLIVLAAAVLTGLLEEVIFRGLILRAFLPKGVTKAVVYSTILFSLFHLLNLIAGEPLLVTLVQLGVAISTAVFMSAITLRSGSLWPAILYHAVHDFVIWMGQGGLQMPTEPSTTWKIIMVAGQVVLLIYGLILLRGAKKR